MDLKSHNQAKVCFGELGRIIDRPGFVFAYIPRNAFDDIASGGMRCFGEHCDAFAGFGYRNVFHPLSVGATRSDDKLSDRFSILSDRI